MEHNHLSPLAAHFRMRSILLFAVYFFFIPRVRTRNTCCILHCDYVQWEKKIKQIISGRLLFNRSFSFYHAQTIEKNQNGGKKDIFECDVLKLIKHRTLYVSKSAVGCALSFIHWHTYLNDNSHFHETISWCCERERAGARQWLHITIKNGFVYLSWLINLNAHRINAHHISFSILSHIHSVFFSSSLCHSL